MEEAWVKGKQTDNDGLNTMIIKNTRVDDTNSFSLVTWADEIAFTKMQNRVGETGCVVCEAREWRGTFKK